MADSSSPASQSTARIVAALLLGTVVLLCAKNSADTGWAMERAPFPFQWRDVALVHLLAALPLAGFLAAFLCRRVSAAVAVTVAAALIGAGLLVMRAPVLDAVQSSALVGVGLRSAIAFAAASGLILAGKALIGWGQTENAPRNSRLFAAMLVVGALVLLILPWSYVAARCRHDRVKLEESLTEMRFGDAQRLAHSLLVLEGPQTWNGRPLAEAAGEIDRNVRALEALVRQPLWIDASPPERMQRARRLAMLGRTNDALEVLQPVREAAMAHHAEDLRGTIHQAREEWAAALESFQRARKIWEAQPESPARTAGIVRAANGVAYSQRKMGQYAAAEATYLEVLALSPTADAHFLLAQLYEDAQQSDKARDHARSAITLAPERYRSAGERLIGKLSTSHFGCFGVFAAERAAQ